MPNNLELPENYGIGTRMNTNGAQRTEQRDQKKRPIYFVLSEKNITDTR